MAPCQRRNRPTGPTNSCSLARKCGRRPRAGASQPATSGGSALLMWFGATISGPSWGRSRVVVDHRDPGRAAEEHARREGQEPRDGREPAPRVIAGPASRLRARGSALTTSPTVSSSAVPVAADERRRRRGRAAAPPRACCRCRRGAAARPRAARPSAESGSSPRSAARRRARSSTDTSR